MRVRCTCPECGDVIIDSRDAVIDEDDHVYRFMCPRGKHVVQKRCNDEVREVLEIAEVRTIDQRCEEFAAVLADDRAIRNALLKA